MQIHCLKHKVIKLDICVFVLVEHLFLHKRGGRGGSCWLHRNCGGGQLNCVAYCRFQYFWPNNVLCDEGSATVRVPILRVVWNPISQIVSIAGAG